MIIVVTGPTASGKTKLSEKLAKKYNGIIVNADSMQIYKKLDIGTAKVKKEEMEDVPHYLFDICNPEDDYSVYDYQRDARKIIENNRDKTIILVGGTGLYIKAALFDYKFEEQTEKNTYDDLTNEELYNMAKDKGFDIHINNRRRLINALNKNEVTNNKNDLLYDAIFIGLKPDRNILYEKINNRVDEMIEEGLLNEVETLYKEYGNVKSLKSGIGYKEIIEYLDGEITLDTAIELIKKRSRHYAKRQFTWFNNQMNMKWFKTDYNNFDNTIKEVIEYLEVNK